MDSSNGMQRLGELHVQRARLLALRLQAFCTGVFPSEWMPRVVEDVTVDLLDFAFHARRVNNICGFDAFTFGETAHTAYSITENNPGGWEACYQHGLNALVHAASFTFGSSKIDHRRIFTASEANLAPLYVLIKTDKFEQRTISLFGVTSCFLIEVVPLIKERYPLWQF